MKDKLEKTGHKKWYYRFRIALVGFFAGMVIGGALASPIMVAIVNAEKDTNQHVLKINQSEGHLKTESYDRDGTRKITQA